jgi:hypothetical protein
VPLVAPLSCSPWPAVFLPTAWCFGLGHDGADSSVSTQPCR